MNTNANSALKDIEYLDDETDEEYENESEIVILSNIKIDLLVYSFIY